MATERVPRRLAAILAADVVGYSRLIRADEEATLAALNGLRTEIIHPTIAVHGGRVFKLMGDEKLMSVAAGMFAGNCASCHARDGGGINGVNLTDNFYKNVKVMTDIYGVITNGANAGAMPAQAAYSKNERLLLAAYVASLRGTKPAAPKALEGSEIPAWPKPGEKSAGK